MSGLATQLVVLIVMTHGFRTVGQWSGPRRGGILLGLPSTTAIVLCGAGLEHGLDESLRLAEAGLLGLVAAVTLPVVYTLVAATGWGLPVAPCAAVTGYLAVATAFSLLPAVGPSGAAGASVLGVVAAVCLAGRTGEVASSSGAASRSRDRRSGWGTLVLRTLIPVACVLCVYGVRSIAGPDEAGLLLPFPATSLSVLVATHLESGPSHACLMARAMPIGALSTLTFLLAFRSLTQGLGPVGGTAFGYLAAACTLLAIEGLSASGHNVNVRVARGCHLTMHRRKMWRRGDRNPAGPVWRHRLDVAQRPKSTRAARLARRTRFSPLVEALAG
jgi:hypothetical protein